MSTKYIIFFVILGLVLAILMASCRSLERKLLFFPTHQPPDGRLAPWTKDGRTVGYARVVASPKNIWLMLYGNGGQASDRAYALPCFSPRDSVYVLEYPGYGSREGKPSTKAFNEAAEEAYRFLRASFPLSPICVASESIGSGPACYLAGLDQPPDKLVLIVPFDKLSNVARDHYPAVVVGLLLSNEWDNIKAIANYHGPVEIYGAADDTIIPVKHAKALAAAVPGAKFVQIDGGHNEWSHQPLVKMRNP
jgi:hypothetical protein